MSTATRSDATATEARSANTGAIKTWTSMQQAYAQTQPVTPDHDVVPIKNPQGEIEILAVGSDGAINWLRRDPESESDWLLKSVPDVSALALGGVTDFDGRLGNVVFGVLKNPKGVATFARLGLSSQHGTLTPRFVSGPIVANPPVVGIDDFSIQHDDSSPLLFQLSATVKQKGSVPPLTCFVQSAPGVKFDRPLWLWKIDREPPHYGGLLTARKAPVLFNTHQSGRGGGFVNVHAAIIDGMLTPLTDDHIHKGSPYDDLDIRADKSLFPPLRAKSFTVLDHPGDNPELLAIDTDHRLRYISSKVPKHENYPKFDASWSSIPLDNPLGEPPELIHLQAIRLYDGGPIHVFAIDTRNFLWVIAQNDKLNWQPPANLGLRAARVAPTFAGHDPRDPAAHRVVVTAPSGALTLLSRTEGGDWVQQPVNIENPKAKEFRTVDSFIGRATVTGANGLPVSAAKVDVGASDEGVYKVNGNLVVLSDRYTTEVEADGQGRVTIETLLDGQLGAPTLSFQSAQLPDRIELRPNQKVQHLFANITADELRDATDPDTGKKVLPAGADFDTLSKSLNEAMKNAAALDDFRRGDAGTRAAPGIAKPWRVQLDVDDRTMAFDRLEPEAFEALWSHAIDPAASREAPGEVGGFLGVDWGNLWEGFRNGVVKIASVAIDKLGRAVVKIGDKLYRFVLKTARQVFDFALALLDFAGAALGRIVGWLLKNFDVFDDWPAILRNRDFIKRTVTSTIRRDVGRIPNLNTYRPAIDNFFDGIKDRVDNSLGPIDQALGTRNSRIRTAAAGRYDWKDVPGLPGDPLTTPLQAIDWILAKLVEVIEDALNVHVPTPKVPNVTNAVEATVDNLGDEIVNDVDKLFERIGEDIESWIKNPRSFEDSAVAALVRDVAEPAIDDAITFGKHLTEDALDIGNAAVKDVSGLVDWMDDEIKLPFLSEFYSTVLDEVGEQSGNKPSFLDIVALMDAMVVTRILGDISQSPAFDATADGGDAKQIALLTSILDVTRVTIGGVLEAAFMALDYAEKGESEAVQGPLALSALFLEVSGLLTAVLGRAAAGKTPNDKPLGEEIVFWTVHVAARFGNIAVIAANYETIDVKKRQKWIKVVLDALPVLIAFGSGLVMLGYGIYLAVQIGQNKQQGNKAAAILVDVMSFLAWLSYWRRTGRPLVSAVIKGAPPPAAAAAIADYAGGQVLLGWTNAALNAIAVHLDTRDEEGRIETLDS